MNEVFVLQQMSIEFAFCNSGHDFVNCSPVLSISVLMNSINGCVEVDIIQISFVLFSGYL